MTNDSKEPFTVQAGKKCKFCGLPQPASNPYCFCENGPEPQEWINWKSGDYIPPNAEWQYWENKTMTKDELGPWTGWNGGECPVDGIPISMDLMLFNGTRHLTKIRPEAWDWSAKNTADAIIAYRIKKEPAVLTDVVMINLNSGMVHDHIDGVSLRSGVYSKAIITLTNGEPSIRWADEG